MIELEHEEENWEDVMPTERKRSERPRISLDEIIRIERQAEKNRQEKIFLRWCIPITILLIVGIFLGINEAYAMYVAQNTDFYHVQLEKPADMTSEDFLSEIWKEAGANGLMLFGMAHDSRNEKALWYGQTVDIYCSEAVKDYLVGIRGMKEGACYGFSSGRVDVTYYDFSELAETDLTHVEFRVKGNGAGVVQFTANVRSFCECEFGGGGENDYEEYHKNCGRILCVIFILICAIWLFYYLYFVRDIKIKITRKVVIGGLIVMALIYGVWWQIAVRLAYGKYEHIIQEKGLYTEGYADIMTYDSFNVTEPIFPAWRTGSIDVTKCYGEECKVSLWIDPKMYDKPEYELGIYYLEDQGSYRSWNMYWLNVDQQMVPVGDNDVAALVEYEKNYDLLCKFWEEIKEEGWLD